MGLQRGLVCPLLDEHQPQRVLAIDMHGVRNASGLLARALHVLEAQLANLIERVLPRGDAAGDDDHSDLPLLALAVMVRSLRRAQNRSAVAASALAPSGRRR